MSEPMFTPGPWKWDPPDEEAHAGRIYRNHDLGAVAIATVEPNEDEEQDYANAALIAAAPELYAALVRITRLQIHFGQYATTTPTVSDAKAIARQALKLVDGVSS